MITRKNKNTTTQLLLAAALIVPLATPGHAANCDDDPQIKIYQKALKADKKNIDNLYNLSVAYYQKSCYEDAISSFEKVLRTNKRYKDAPAQVDPEGYSILGYCYYQELKDAKKAV